MSAPALHESIGELAAIIAILGRLAADLASDPPAVRALRFAGDHAPTALRRVMHLCREVSNAS